APAGAAAPRADTAKKPELPWKPWAEVTRDARVVPGLFTAYLKRESVYLALGPEHFDRDYLLVTQLSQGAGDFGLDGGSSMRSDLVRFHRAGDKVQLWVVNPYVTAPPNTPMAQTVAYSFGHSVAHAFPIASIRDTTNEVLIDLAPFLVSDWVDIGSFFDFLIRVFRLQGGAAFDKDRSSFETLRMFPGNLEADVRLTYRSNRALGMETLADYRYVPIGVHYSLLELPAVPMRPRPADDRVGYFISARKDFSRDTAETFFVRYLNRWRLEPKDPGAAVSEPAKPIVYYLDRTIPHEWRPYVREGILAWNRAFEEAGWKNAIRVLDAPEGDTTWAAEDARYSTVRWMANMRSTYAIGPADVDPRTGEILNADILIAASWIQAFQGEYRTYSGPQAMIREAFLEDSVLRADPRGRATGLCTYPAGLARRSTLLRASLAEAGVLAPGAPVPREYVGQALKELVMHEVGHTLGLRHNFRGTATIPRERLTDRAFTAAHGTSGSVMDYNPPAVALDRRQQGDYYSGTIGTYDRWAIRYGYAPVRGDSPDAERAALARIAAEAAHPDHLYGSDEDAGFGGFGLDPTVTRYDQSADPLAWARDQVRLVNRLFDSLEVRLVAPGDPYTKLRAGFMDLLFERWFATLVATKYVGGAYSARDHRGDPGGRPPFQAVPAAKQREALGFIAREGLGEAAYRFSPALLNRLAPERWLHWGANPFTVDRIDFPLHDWALAFQGTLLDLLFEPGVLSRLRDAELRAGVGEAVLTLPELFGALTTAVWAELGGAEGRARNPSSIRRDLQREYLGMLIRMVVSPRPGLPEDARTVARVTLVELAAGMERALAHRDRLDAYTVAHLLDSRERIRQALEARVVQSAGPVR
ncbi:MAG TPA: zinc-dependent metalloprotease, partial [Gemmatimonadales bacterium]|nr:zinc-dependent metalloprotease [Gemmatimonadales bacterium]